MSDLPRIAADQAPLSPFAAAFALVLTPDDVRARRTAALLMARGFDRKTIEAAIDDAERLVLKQTETTGDL
ncbi:hypothetical protein [Phreatobacter oligotrophus]|uniref:hypothetical protein n=1 Tax=Phreatobacter oligotrophus TaxID=1122261 RepID=UPI0011B26741|nr:hypothetical protein [Phreatobacter oligotrophus]